MKLYFAGPLFTTPERTWNAEVVAALRAAGHEIFLPQEQDPGKDAAGIFATDVGGIDWADGLVAIMDGPDPDSGSCWEVGYAYGSKKPIVLVRTDLRDLAGNAGRYNPIMAESATIRLDLPAASTTEVIDAILEALSTIGAGNVDHVRTSILCDRKRGANKRPRATSRRHTPVPARSQKLDPERPIGPREATTLTEE